MKTVKFRAWFKKHNEIYNVTQIDFELGCVCIEEDDWVLNFEEIILMQSTGLKDKSGVEIYEGDICSVEANVWGALITRTGEVTFNEDDLQFQIMSGDEWSFFTKEYFEKCEIIGNIYQNKELLEVQS